MGLYADVKRMWASNIKFSRVGVVAASHLLASVVTALSGHTALSSTHGDLLNAPLRDIRSGNISSLATDRHRNILIMIFEPECPWCLRQTATLNQLVHECSDVQVIGVGIHAERDQLGQEVRKLRMTFPAYVAGKDFLRATGKIPGTPYLVAIDRYNQTESVLRGYHSIDDIRHIFGDTCNTGSHWQICGRHD